MLFVFSKSIFNLLFAFFTCQCQKNVSDKAWRCKRNNFHKNTPISF